MASKPNQPSGELAPFSQEAEEAALGSCIIDPAMYGVLAAFLHPEDFYILRHRYIFEAMQRIHQRGDLVEYVTIQEELRTTKRLEDIGGSAYLLHLTNCTPTSARAEVYGRLVERTARRRRYLEHADEIKAMAMDESLSMEKITETIDHHWLLAQRASDSRMTPIRDALDRHFEKTEEMVKNPRLLLGIPSEIDDMNHQLRGYQGGRLYVPAGRPGMGKSSWMLTEAVGAAARGMKVFFASLEMPESEVVDNLISIHSRIPIEHIQTGGMDGKEWRLYVEVVGRMGNWSVTITDQAAITPLELRAACRKQAAQFGLDIIFVDYIQLMSGGRESRYDNRDQEIGYISRTLKQLAKELNVPVIAAAQLSREVEKREDKRPRLSDLRESGNIENDADVVMFFYRDDYYHEPAQPNVISPTEISIAKNRGGRTGMVNAGFHGEIKRFVPLVRQ